MTPRPEGFCLFRSLLQLSARTSVRLRPRLSERPWNEGLHVYVKADLTGRSG